ncbi:MAG: hypothetical protein ABIN89_13740 [Chitinophagaceae bacterium]
MKTACISQNFSGRENMSDSDILQRISQKQKKKVVGIFKFTIPVPPFNFDHSLTLRNIFVTQRCTEKARRYTEALWVTLPMEESKS